MMATRASRYLVVGTISFLIDFAVTWFAYQFIPLLAANTIGFLVANVVNFLLAHRWVFGQAWQVKSVTKAYVAVLSISVIGLLLNNMIVWVTVSIYGVTLLLGKAIAAVVVLMWNFLARHLWIYKKKVPE